MLMKFKLCREFFLEKYSNMEFHENPFGGNRVFHADRRGRGGGWTHMTKLTVAFRHFTKAPNNGQNIFMQIGSVTSYVSKRISVLSEVKVVRRFCKIARSDY